MFAAFVSQARRRTVLKAETGITAVTKHHEEHIFLEEVYPVDVGRQAITGQVSAHNDIQLSRPILLGKPQACHGFKQQLGDLRKMSKRARRAWRRALVLPRKETFANF